MDGEGAGIADVGHVVHHLEGIDETAAGFVSVLELESDQRAKAAAEVRVGTPAHFTILTARIDDLGDFRVR